MSRKPHRLDPLLRPRSVAVIGASARPDSMGDWVLENLERGGFAGPVYPVNPGYGEIRGHACHADVASLPETPDLAIFAVGDHRIEAALEEVVAAGIPAAVIMSSLVLDEDRSPNLKARVKAKADAAGMLVCGANGMGFYNIRDRVWACGFDSRRHEAPGNVTLISHSGSGMCGIVDCERRIRFNLAVSTGNEIGVTMDQYLDFALELPETRAVGLFIETARNPGGFRAALEKAAERRIPIVALKVGRTARAAKLTVSHSGAMAGDDATYDALFDRYGVQRVRDMDELATALILFATLDLPGQGGLVTLHDSGGERQLLVDLAAETGVPLTELSAETVAALRKVVPPELPSVNPLDAWSRGGPDAGKLMAEAFSRLLADPGAAIGAAIHDRGPDSEVYESYLGYLERAQAATGKPVALVASRQGSGADDRAERWTHAGYPVLDGVLPFLCGVRAMFAYRDFLGRPKPSPPRVDEEAAARWRDTLAEEPSPGEFEALAMLGDFGVPVPSMRRVASREEALAAAGELACPLVLKTARAGIAHKSDSGGVVLGIEDGERLAAAYDELAARLGPEALLAEQAGPGTEMLLGARRDPQFGPVVLIGIGGVLAEVLEDVTFALPPFDAAHARRCVGRLRLSALLDGVRGSPRADLDAFCEAAARFSAMIHALGGIVEEVDVNPLIVSAEGCIAVDALVVARAAESG